MKTSELLQQAKLLIATPETWTTRSYAKDNEGNSCSDLDEDACSFCSSGAINRASRNAGSFLFNKAEHHLQTVTRDKVGDNINCSYLAYNDRHTHAEVMELWDQAIELAIKEGD